MTATYDAEAEWDMNEAKWLESLWQAGLFQRFICCVPGFRSSVDREMALGQGTIPHFVIASPLSNKVAALGHEKGFQLAQKAAHC